MSVDVCWLPQVKIFDVTAHYGGGYHLCPVGGGRRNCFPTRRWFTKEVSSTNHIHAFVNVTIAVWTNHRKAFGHLNRVSSFPPNSNFRGRSLRTAPGSTVRPTFSARGDFIEVSLSFIDRNIHFWLRYDFNLALEAMVIQLFVMVLWCYRVGC